VVNQRSFARTTVAWANTVQVKPKLGFWADGRQTRSNSDWEMRIGTDKSRSVY